MSYIAFAILLASCISSQVNAGILKKIPPLLTADILHALSSAGHGDVIVLVDANYPAVTTAKSNTLPKPIVLSGADTIQALDAILTLMPLDFFVKSPALYMDPDNGGTLSPEAKEVHALANATIYNHTGVRMKPVERTNFYKKAANTGFVVIQAAAERRPYACFMLQHGVVGPDGKDLKP